MRDWILKYEGVISTLLILGILVCLNLIGMKSYARWDLTEDKVYTLSEGFKKILSKLEDRLIVKVYSTGDLPFQLAGHKQQVRDFLDEVRVVSGGRVVYEFLNTDKKEVADEARRVGVPEAEVTVFERDSAQVKKIFFGMVLYYQDKKEIMRFVGDLEDLEYDFSVKVLKLLEESRPKIAIMAGEDQRELKYSDLELLRDMLSSRYLVTRSMAGEKIGDDVRVLLITKHKAAEREKALFEIDQYLMRGGKVIFCGSGMDGPPFSMYAQTSSNKLFNLFAHYGVKVNKDMVVDISNARAAFSGGIFTVMLPYPFFVRIIPEWEGRPWGFNREISSVSRLRTVVLQWPSSLDLGDTDPRNEEIPLVYTTPRADRLEGFVSVSYQQKFNFDEEGDSYLLAALSHGVYSSYFEKEDTVSSVPENEWNARRLVSETTSFVVIGTEHFLHNRSLQDYPSNLTFIQNLIDQLALGDELIEIRSKNLRERPIPVDVIENETKKNTIRLANTVGVPAVVVLFGFVRYFRRRQKVRRGVL